MLNELALRRPDFLGGTPVRLADGQTWLLPSPVRPTADSSGFLKDTLVSIFGRDYLPTLAAVMEAQDEAERLLAELALAIELLGRNYRLSPDQFQQILEGARGDAVMLEIQRAFRIAATDHSQAVLDLGGDISCP